jgi:hypothetical protein
MKATIAASATGGADQSFLVLRKQVASYLTDLI